MTRLVVSLLCLVVLMVSGCGGSQEAGPPTGVDTKTIEDYQAQAEGDSYKNYVEPK